MDKDNMGMLGYQLGLYEKSMPNRLSLAEKLKLAKESGYDYLELSIDETPEKLKRLDWSDRERMMAAAASEGAVPIGSICLSGHRKYPLGHPDPAVQRQSLEIMEKTLRLAVELGVRTIQLAGYDVYYENSTPQTEAIFRRNLFKCVEMAARDGVVLAFETMETAFLNTVKKGMRWVDEIASPYLQLYPDAGNITNAADGCAEAVCADLETGREHLVALHLKETRAGVYREVPYGQGWVDFEALTASAMSLGVRRFVAEFWDVGLPDWETTLLENNRLLRQYLDAAACKIYKRS